MRIKRTTNFDDDFDLDPNLNIKYDFKKVDSDSVLFVYFGWYFAIMEQKRCGLNEPLILMMILKTFTI